MGSRILSLLLLRRTKKPATAVIPRLSLKHYSSYNKNNKNKMRIMMSSMSNYYYSTSSSTTPDLICSSKNSAHSSWVPVYRFNYILLLRLVQRFKIYQTGFTILIILPSTITARILEAHELLETTTTATPALYTALGISSLACGMLVVVGLFCSRLIGMVYVDSNDLSLIRVSRLSFLGHRTDKIIPSNTFIPITDYYSKDPNTEPYINLQLIEQEEEEESFIESVLKTDKTYYLSIKHGTLIQRDTFQLIFGTIPSSPSH